MNIFNHFEHLKLTNDQQMALEKINAFLKSDDDVFILKGYAGSGKTTMLKGIVSFLAKTETNYQLMAPTGRAAKVINQKTGIKASTIHKGIYSFEDLQEIEITNNEGDLSFIYYYKLRNNPEVYNSVLIIDEASMISNVPSHGEFFRFGSGYLLNDLLSYSGINRSTNKTKIIFVGDPAQLSPVGMNFSPALDEDYVREKVYLKVVSAEIKEVKRQNSENGILKAASKIRRSITSGFYNNFDLRPNSKDIFNPTAGSFLNTYNNSKGSKVIITHKNKTALDINQSIRLSKYGSKLPVQKSDVVIIGHNNYNLGIMNGEFGVVISSLNNTVTHRVNLRLKGGETKSVDLTWRWVELLFDDIEGQSKIVKGYMLENYLYGDNYLKPEEQQALYVDFRKRHPKLKPKSEEFKKAILNDQYFNCIQLKFGYAVTCHKAQGGEWDTAFVFWDRGVKNDFDFYRSEHDRSGKTNSGFYRWAYTAVTRAANKLECINPPYFNSFSKMAFVDLEVQNAFEELNDTKITPTEITVNESSIELLKQYGLSEVASSLQDHFLKINYLSQSRNIEITNWERVNYEVRYYFKREGETAAIKFWVNGKNEFKSNFIKLPAGTNSDDLFVEVALLPNSISGFVIQRNTIESILEKIELDVSTEEEKPFLKSLLDSLEVNCNDYNIQIESVNHHQWRERYTFSRQREIAVIDFEYDKGGFFGRVLPLRKKCNSDNLLTELQQIFKKFNNPEYVV